MKQPGQVETDFWRRYVAGGLRSLADLVEARRQLAASHDAAGVDRFTKDPIDGANFDAPLRLKAPSMMTAEPTLKNHARADWQHADWRLKRWSAMFIEAARKRDVPLYVHSCFRTKAEQDELVRRKVTKAPYPNSAHNIGEAVDIVHAAFHWQMTRQEWDYLAILGRESLRRLNATLKAEDKLLLVWGGDWKYYDPAHWEIQDYATRRRVLPVLEPVRLTPRAILGQTR